MNETLARQFFKVVVDTFGDQQPHAALDLVESCSLTWPSFPWLDWASDWEHEQLAKRYAA